MICKLQLEKLHKSLVLHGNEVLVRKMAFVGEGRMEEFWVMELEEGGEELSGRPPKTTWEKIGVWYEGTRGSCRGSTGDGGGT